MKAIILAGGFATRLWPLTEKKAKPLLFLKDKTIISHIVENIPDEIEIIISTNAVFKKDFLDWAKLHSNKKIEIFVEDSITDDFKKGALGATALVIQEKNIDDDLMLIAGDNYFGFKMQDFISAYKGNSIIATYDIEDLNEAKKFGVIISKDNKIIEFQEKPENPKSTLVGTGCYIFPKKHLKDIVHYAKENNDDLGGIFEYLLKKHEEINTFIFKENWFDIGSFSGYLNANKILLNNQIIKEDDDMEKAENNDFINGVYIAKSCKIKNSTIENSIILKNCEIDNCVIRNSIVDEGSKLKGIDLNYQMIRAGSEICK